MTKEELVTIYVDLIKSYYMEAREEYLFKASELGRTLVKEQYPLEDIGELHELALKRLSEEVLDLSLQEAIQAITAPLIELLMSYQLAFRQVIDENLAKTKALEIKERALASAKNGILITDPNQHDNPIIYANKAFEDITGYSFDEIVGKNCRFLQGTDRNQPELDRVRQAINQQKEVTAVVRNYRKDGTLFWNDLNISPVKDENGNLTHFVGIQNDITAEVRARQELEDSREELRALAAHLQSVREEERANIAREIHDEFGQVIVAIKMNLSLLGRLVSEHDGKVDIAAFNSEVEQISNMIDVSISSLRSLITELRPEILDTLGLWEAIKWQISEFEKMHKIKCVVTSNINRLEMDKKGSIAVYRIVQEALTNIGRHANATKVECDFSRNGKKLIMRIADNGVGLPRNRSKLDGFGILGMQERVHVIGGKIEFQSKKNQGTTVLVEIPLAQG